MSGGEAGTGGTDTGSAGTGETAGSGPRPALDITVVGSWHLAAVTAAGLADIGHRVCCVDTDAAAIASLSAGRPPVFEPGLEAQTRRNLGAGRLRFTTDFGMAAAFAPIALLAQDTPLRPGGVDVEPLFASVRHVARAARRDFLLVVGSQSPIGTCERLAEAAREANATVAVELAHVPEFLRLGAAVELFRRPDRVIIGASTRAAGERTAAIFAPLARPTLIMGLREAEMVKHATNAFVATQVSFTGEIAQLCDELGADALPVGRALRLDRRIGEAAYVLPGLGFNGGTVRRDVDLLLARAAELGRQAPLLQAVLDVNARQNALVAARLAEALGGLDGAVLALFGLTYKARTSTLRGSLTLQVAEQLRAAGASLRAWDPIVAAADYEPAWSLEPCASATEATRDADALVVMTPKEEFGALDLVLLGRGMRRRVLADPMGVFDRARAHAAGFTYLTIGRGRPVAAPG